MAILTPEDHAFFRENGYVLVKNVVPKENCERAIDAMFEFLEMDRNDPSDWYRMPLKPPAGVVEMYQHQAMWDNRQHPRVHQLYTEILGTEKLWVVIDRMGFKPPYNPEHPEYDHKGFLHWDVDTSKLPVPFGVQGVLYLADTGPDQGGFICVPGFHGKALEEWINTQPADRNPRVPDRTGLNVVPIPGETGDMVIWDRTLAHGNGRNTSDRPRFAQYIAMFPAERGTEEQREHRVRCWLEREPPGNAIFPGDPRRWEQEHGKTAELTPLGRKLLGADPW